MYKAFKLFFRTRADRINQIIPRIQKVINSIVVLLVNVVCKFFCGNHYRTINLDFSLAVMKKI